MNMKKGKILAIGAILALSLAGCGSSKEEASLPYYDSSNYDVNYTMKNEDLGYSEAETYQSDYEDAAVEESYDGAGDTQNDSANKIDDVNNQKSIDEMLVYECQLTINTINFDDSISSFKESIKENGGFVENENYEQNSYSYNYYEDNSDNSTDRSYYAVVRIPSANYESFTGKLGDLGRIKNKTANVTNMTQEYKDAKTALEIYEAKQKRYLKLLEDIDDEQYAIQIENELTDLEIKIAQLKTRMNSISKDVDYSTVTVTIKEVNKYSTSPAEFEEMPYIDQLVDTIKTTFEVFTRFLGNFLLVLIRVSPFLIFWGLFFFAIVMIIRAIIKGIIKKNRKKKEMKIAKASANANPQVIPEQKAPVEDKKIVENKESGNKKADNK